MASRLNTVWAGCALLRTCLPCTCAGDVPVFGRAAFDQEPSNGPSFHESSFPAACGHAAAIHAPFIHAPFIYAPFIHAPFIHASSIHAATSPAAPGRQAPGLRPAAGPCARRSPAGRRSGSESGYTLVEALGAIIVSSLMLVVLGSLWQRGSDWLSQSAAASHLLQVTEAARDYCLGNWSAFSQNAAETSGPVFDVADLVNEGYLPEGFEERNPWNQTYEAHVRRVTIQTTGSSGSDSSGSDSSSSDSSTSRLYLVLLTRGGRGTDFDAGNSHFLNVLAPGAARRGGSWAGFIPTGEVGEHGEGTLVAGNGGYALTLADFGISSPGAGHLGAYTRIEETDGDDSAYLHRNAVSGHPELNQMETTLDMTGNPIVNVGHLDLESFGDGDDRPLDTTSGSTCTADEAGRLFLDETFGLYLCRWVDGFDTPQLVLLSDSANTVGVQSMTIATHNERVQKPSCARGTGTTPQIFLATTIASSGPQSPAMAAYQAWAEDEGDAWRITLRVKNVTHDIDGWYEPTTEGDLALHYGAVQVVTACVREERTGS